MFENIFIVSVTDFATIFVGKSNSKYPVSQEKHYTPKLFFYSMTLPTALYNSALFVQGGEEPFLCHRKIAFLFRNAIFLMKRWS